MPTTLGERQIARVVYDVAASFDRAMGLYTVPWADAKPSERAAMLNVVRNVKRHPDMTAAQWHFDWLVAKRRQGWRWGPSLSEELKAHPSLMPWDERPLESRIKDELIIGVVKCLMQPIPNQG